MNFAEFKKIVLEKGGVSESFFDGSGNEVFI